MNYKFISNEKEYILSENNCEGIFFENDEKIDGLNLDIILNALNEGEDVVFTNEYYGGKCICDAQERIGKSYRYLEYHFYIYTINNKYVINTICSDYKDTSFNKLFRAGKVDKSYIVNVTVCPCCGSYSVEVDECEV